jgi:hypothetical protein
MTLLDRVQGFARLWAPWRAERPTLLGRVLGVARLWAPWRAERPTLLGRVLGFAHRGGVRRVERGAWGEVERERVGRWSMGVERSRAQMNWVPTFGLSIPETPDPKTPNAYLATPSIRPCSRPSSTRDRT